MFTKSLSNNIWNSSAYKKMNKKKSTKYIGKKHAYLLGHGWTWALASIYAILRYWKNKLVQPF